jgi:hypothetical protein
MSMSSHYHGLRRSNQLLIRKVDENEMVVFDRLTHRTHLLQSEHLCVLELVGSLSVEEIAAGAFPQLEPSEARTLTEAVLDQLLEKEILVCDVKLSRRTVAKAMLLAPAIMTFAAPAPAAADSLGEWTSTGPGETTVMVPNGAMSINYTVRGGGGGGGGGGGRAVQFPPPGPPQFAFGANGGAGAEGEELSGMSVPVTGGSNLTVRVGGGGAGGGGGGGGRRFGMTLIGGMGGSGGAGGFNSGSGDGDNGVDGGTTSPVARGGGGGGGGRGGDSEIVDIVVADGGTGGGGGEGGMAGMGMVATNPSDPGDDGNAGGAGGASGGMATDGGDGGGFPTATPTASGAGGGIGSTSTGFGGGDGTDGSDGEDGSITIVFCA